MLQLPEKLHGFAADVRNRTVHDSPQRLQKLAMAHHRDVMYPRSSQACQPLLRIKNTRHQLGETLSTLPIDIICISTMPIGQG